MIIVHIQAEYIQIAIICPLQPFMGLIYFFCIHSLFNNTDKSLNITANKGVNYLFRRKKVIRLEESKVCFMTHHKRIQRYLY